MASLKAGPPGQPSHGGRNRHPPEMFFPRMVRLLTTTLLVACATLGASATLPADAPAAPYMVSIMQDDNQLIYGTTGQRRNALNRMKSLGVEAVRVTMLWRVVAPEAAAKRKPRRFNGAKPGAYPAHHWDRFDELVVDAQARGIAVYLNPTGAGPRWAHAKTRERAAQRSFRPSTREFKRFVRAAGRRYSGRYRDENAGRQVLPRVTWWAIWNEPNQPGWLTPQGEKKRGVGMIPMSPQVYRDLLVAGARGLLASGHGDDLVLIGELAPLGFEKPKGTRPALRPGIFLREMFCLNRRYRPFRGRHAKARGCDRLDRLGVLERLPRIGFAHHPYTKKLAPSKRDKGRDAMTMANIGTLPKALDKIARRTGLIPVGMPVFLTEYGYETNPPDPFSGVAPALQAEYINEGDYRAWRHPRIFSNAQFQLFDVPPRDEHPRDTPGHWFTYQSGLYSPLPEGAPKPSATAYKFPLLARLRGGAARLWGQARFAPNGAVYQVLIQRRVPGSSQWARAGVVTVTNNQGYFRTRIPATSGTTFRAVWAEPDFSRTEVSREAVAR